MKSYVFSIGELTTELCCEQLKRLGFDVVLLQDNTTLQEKLKRFYTEAIESGDEFAMRADADIIPNNRVKHLKIPQGKGWVCANGFDWYKQDRGAISIHMLNKETLKKCLAQIDNAKGEVRPETFIWRHPTINPYTCVSNEYNYGLHGYGQRGQRERIKALKYARGQEYDWDLIERIEAL